MDREQSVTETDGVVQEGWNLVGLQANLQVRWRSEV